MAEGLFSVPARIPAQAGEGGYRADNDPVRGARITEQRPALGVGRILLAAVACLAYEERVMQATPRSESWFSLTLRAAHACRNLIVRDEGAAHVFGKSLMRDLAAVNL